MFTIYVALVLAYTYVTFSGHGNIPQILNTAFVPFDNLARLPLDVYLGAFSIFWLCFDSVGLAERVGLEVLLDPKLDLN